MAVENPDLKHAIHFSSMSNEWETPRAFFDRLDKEYKFTLDPCATHDNHLCHKYYTKEHDGLNQSWAGHTVFMNPPYGREISKWVKKAYEESQQGTTIVCLVPARTDTRYWHNYIFGKAEVHFIKGRLKFENREHPDWKADGSHKVSSAPFPSAIIIYKKTSRKASGRPRRLITVYSDE